MGLSPLPPDIERAVRHALAGAGECEWIEFKEGNTDPELIGRTLAALSNSALLAREPWGYLIFGVSDDRRIVSTPARLADIKAGNQLIQIFLAKLLRPAPVVDCFEGTLDGHALVVFRIPPASNAPVSFKGVRYIRVGSSTTELSSQPAIEKMLWRALDQSPVDRRRAAGPMTPIQATDLLDHARFFEIAKRPAETDPARVAEQLAAANLIAREGDEVWITYAGAALFAKDLTAVGPLAGKGVRVVVYEGQGKSRIVRQREFSRGYILDFVDLLDWIGSQLPANEQIGAALRVESPVFPPVAVREIVANALIHQDLAIDRSGTLVEIFANRVEITNPGRPLLAPDRFLDMQPAQRNPSMAKLMRQARMCEDLGSGIDRAFEAVERQHLPAPKIETLDGEGFTRVTLYAPKTLDEMTPDDRVRACYQHAALAYVNHGRMTNTTFRQRLGLPESAVTAVSKIITQAVDARLVKPDPAAGQSRRHARYVPFWAS